VGCNIGSSQSGGFKPRQRRDRQGPAATSPANAIANATGKRLRNLPLTRKRIKNAIDA
jgi:hypothetical protein